jgi:hypothetical protein
MLESVGIWRECVKPEVDYHDEIVVLGISRNSTGMDTT